MSHRILLLVAVAAGALAACRTGPMSRAGDVDTRRAALRLYDTIERAMRTGDMMLFDAVLATGAVDHDPVPGMAPGRDGIKRAFAEVRAAFPDYHAEVEDVVVEGDKAACRITARMTHRGKPITLRGIDILRFENGLLVERWGQFQSPPE